jgi:hypothetical protein
MGEHPDAETGGGGGGMLWIVTGHEVAGFKCRRGR